MQPVSTARLEPVHSGIRAVYVVFTRARPGQDDRSGPACDCVCLPCRRPAGSA